MSVVADHSTDLPAGFADHYQQQILPELQRMERRRQTAVKLIYAGWALAVVGGLSFVAGGLFAPTFGLDDEPFLFGGFVAGVAGVLWQATVRKRLTRALKAALVSPTCRFFGLDYAARPEAFPVDRFARAGLFARDYDKTALEDEIVGERAQVHFQLCEARLERRDDRHDGEEEAQTAIVFEGLLLIYRFPKPFEGETRILPDLTWLGNRLLARAFQPDQPGERVILEDARFEQRYEVYSTDQIEARYLLTPRFMERLVDLADHFGNQRNVSLAFSGSDLLIAVRTSDDRFEGGSIFQPLADHGRVEALVRELSLVFEIIDILKLHDRSGA